MLMVKNPPANAGDLRDAGSVSVLGRSPGIENGNPVQYSYLEKSVDRGTWRATACGVAKSCARLKRLSTHTRILQKQLVHGAVPVSTGVSPVTATSGFNEAFPNVQEHFNW